MKLPGIQRQEVQSLGRRDINIGYDSAARVRAINEGGRNRQEQGLEYTRQARKEDLRGSGAIYDSLPTDVRIANTYRDMREGIAQAERDRDLGISDANYRADISKAESKGNKFNAFANIAFGVAELSIDNQERIAERNVQEAGLETREDVSRWKSKYEGKEYLTPADIAGTVAGTPENMRRSVIPTAEVLPAMLEEHLNNIIKANSGMIKNEYFRDSWMAEMTDIAANQVDAAIGEANKFLESQIKTKQNTEITQAMDNNNLPLAVALIKDSFNTDEDKKVLLEKAAVLGEKSIYDGLATEQNVPGMRAALKELQKPFDEYRKKGGKLNSDDRRIQASMLRSEIAKIESINANQHTADYSGIKRRFSQFVTRVTDGHVPTDEDMETGIEIKAQAMALLGKPGFNTAFVQEIDEAVVAMDLWQEHAKTGTIARELSFETLRTTVNDMDIGEQGYYGAALGHLEKWSAAQDAAMDKNLLDASIGAGHEVSTINFAADPQHIPAQLEKRLSKRDQMNAVYGRDSSHVLRKVEVQQLSDMMSSMSSTEQVAMMGIINDGLGMESTGLYEQMRNDSNSTFLSVVGERFYATGDPFATASMLEGKNYYDTHSTELNEITKQLPLAIWTEIGETYSGNPVLDAAYKEAISYAYIGITEGMDRQVVKDSKLKEAINIAVGERITQGGNTIPSFGQKLTQHEADEWMAGVPDEYINETLGGAIDDIGGLVPPDSIREGLMEGDMKLKYVGYDTYFIELNSGQYLQSFRNDGKLFQFKYDPAVISTVTLPELTAKGQMAREQARKLREIMDERELINANR